MSVIEALQLKGVELLSHDSKGSVKRVKAEDALNGKTVGIYFSASWCPPCHAFTPHLARVYAAVKKTHPDFEILFVSGDKTKAAAEAYFDKMPWLAVSFEDVAMRGRLNSLFTVMGIPRLVICGPDGQVIASDARVAVQNDAEGEQFPWDGSSTAGQALLGTFLSPRGIMMIALIAYWIAQYFGYIK
ncbi:hypothetical protein D9Q98_003120 [Chlorella vulgaris]|uniref:Thioredoxin domain-containing protein n=1 Tax=Chlorella vulgaris TaxID=3077 RepID=A0A9D4TS81_CHLVU|nr:hypothetical protein D9Q98_003120 [Chlorella vulgaris]